MINTYTRTYKATTYTNSNLKAKHYNTVEAKVYYSLGGMNYWTYKVEPRGYYFSLTPYRVEGIMRSFIAGDGYKTCILECGRQSKKRYEEAKAMMDGLLDEYMDWFLVEYNIELLDGDYTESERDSKAA